jgi:hypothetical protein
MDGRMETNPRLQQRLRPLAVACALFAFIVGISNGMGPLFTVSAALLAIYMTVEWVKHRKTAQP